MRCALLATSACLVLLAPATARAHLLGLRLDHSRTPPTSSSPVSGSSGASLTGSYDFNDDVSLDAGFGISRPLAAPPTQGEPDKTSGGTVVNLSLGGSWFYGDHWFFLGAASLSPKSTSMDTTTVSLQDGKGSQDVDGLIKADSSTAGVLLSTSYSTAGESNAETEVALTLNGTHLSTTQKLQELGDTNLQKLRDFCKAGGKGSKQCKRYGPLLDSATELLNTLSVGVLVTETLYDKTDVLLGGTWYLYDRDPNEVGYFTLATAGKGARPGAMDKGGPADKAGGADRGGASFGTGIALAPTLWSGSLGVSRKLADLRLTLTGGYGQYVDDGGDFRSLTLKALYKFSAMWRVVAQASAQRDVDESATSTTSFSGSATVRCSF